ncbi:hypothetical protein U8V72_14445 [Priestia filamentosa]|uniref:hypothetical protein n=1 Tax=Priestia filamentosa TaxID=1402861 RepID=UPI0005890497
MNYNVYLEGVPKKERGQLLIPEYITFLSEEELQECEFGHYKSSNYYIAYLKDKSNLENVLFEIGLIGKTPVDYGRPDREVIVVLDNSFPVRLSEDIWFALEMADEVVTVNKFNEFWDDFIKRNEIEQESRFYYVLEKKRVTRLKSLVTEFCNNYVRNKYLSVEQINYVNRWELAQEFIQHEKPSEKNFSKFKEDIAKQIDLKLPMSYLNKKNKTKKNTWNISEFGLNYHFEENETIDFSNKNSYVSAANKLKTVNTFEEVATEKQIGFIKILLEQKGLKEIKHLKKLTKGSAGILINFLKEQRGEIKKLPSSISSNLSYVGLPDEEIKVGFSQSNKPILFEMITKEDKKELMKEWGFNSRKKNFKLIDSNQRKYRGELVGFEGIFEKKCVLNVDDIKIVIDSDKLKRMQKEGK